MFGDTEDALDAIFGSLPGAQPRQETPEPAPIAAPADQAPAFDKTSPYFKPCAKCNGRGTFRSYTGRHVGECFACKGAGGVMLKTTSDERARRLEADTARKAAAVDRVRQEFGAENADELEYLLAEAGRFEFATSLLAALDKYGHLTEKQLIAVRSLVWKKKERQEQRAAEAQERQNAAVAVSVDKLHEALQAARTAGLKHPKLRYEGFVVSLAPADGKNAGALYLKQGSTYLGKIQNGKLFATREADEVKPAIVVAMEDPLAAAKAYGQKFGICSCCGRDLSDPVSVAAGIGPVCAENFGF